MAAVRVAEGHTEREERRAESLSPEGPWRRISVVVCIRRVEECQRNNGPARVQWSRQDRAVAWPLLHTHYLSSMHVGTHTNTHSSTCRYHCACVFVRERFSVASISAWHGGPGREDVISITFTGLINLPWSRIVFVCPRSIYVALSCVLESQQLPMWSFSEGTVFFSILPNLPAEL